MKQPFNHEPVQQAGAPRHLADLDRRLRGWRPDRIGTLLFLMRDGQVLLIRKRRGHGAGRINGPGGKPDAGESPLACALRETEEEVGVRVAAARLAAVLRFLDVAGDDWLGYVFVAEQGSGTPRTTAEAIPAWHALDALPFDEMWEDDRVWLPRVLAGDSLEGDFLFDAGRLLAHRLRRVDPAALGDPSAAV